MGFVMEKDKDILKWYEEIYFLCLGLKEKGYESKGKWRNTTITYAQNYGAIGSCYIAENPNYEGELYHSSPHMLSIMVLSMLEGISCKRIEESPIMEKKYEIKKLKDKYPIRFDGKSIPIIENKFWSIFEEIDYDELNEMKELFNKSDN